MEDCGLEPVRRMVEWAGIHRQAGGRNTIARVLTACRGPRYSAGLLGVDEVMILPLQVGPSSGVPLPVTGTEVLSYKVPGAVRIVASIDLLRGI